MILIGGSREDRHIDVCLIIVTVVYRCLITSITKIDQGTKKFTGGIRESRRIIEK